MFVVLETGNNYGSEYKLFNNLTELSEWFVKSKDTENGNSFIAVHRYPLPLRVDADGFALFNHGMWFANLVKLDIGTLLVSKDKAPHQLLEKYRVKDLKGLVIDGRS